MYTEIIVQVTILKNGEYEYLSWTKSDIFEIGNPRYAYFEKMGRLPTTINIYIYIF